MGAVEPWWPLLEFSVCCKTICGEEIGKEDKILIVSICTDVVVYLLEVKLFLPICDLYYASAVACRAFL